MSPSSYVVTGGARGIGRAIVDRLAADGAVVVIDRVPADGVETVVGDAAVEAVAERAADLAEGHGPLAGWVNNAAVFRDATLADTPAADVLALIDANLAPALTGAAVAVRRFRAHGAGGAIVFVSSHQAQRPVRGALPYAVAKAALEGLTRAVAVEHGPDGIRANAVALGSVATDRLDDLRATRPEVDTELRRLHPLGRIGTPAEVAAVVAHLLGPDASWVTGAVVPVDGGRSVLGLDPESA